MDRTEILKRLIAGNEKFITDKLSSHNQDSNRRETVTKGQDPFAIILSCADSRVVPELIFDTGIGELFVVRVAGNVANTSSLASIEYAVAHLGTKVIVVLSHEDCGAVTAAVRGGDNGNNIKHLLSHITPAIQATVNKTNVNEIAQKNALLTAEDLIKKSTIISDAVNSGKLHIVPAYYHLRTGGVDFLK
ncbi:MAG: carbonic anhydrase [Bacteroidota bacterium]